ncbi:MAG: hypothetical protein U5Q03_17920 [Bacteroidota bacterium]|nr:hypothetical protein [Bacteroidota bacterium]
MRVPFDMSDYSDGIIGYDLVTEEVNSGEGYTEYYFYNEATYNDYDNISYPSYTNVTPQLIPSWKDVKSYEIDNQLIAPVSHEGLQLDVNSYPFSANTNYSWFRGLPKKTVYIDENSKKVQQTDYQYTFLCQWKLTYLFIRFEN